MVRHNSPLLGSKKCTTYLHIKFSPCMEFICLRKFLNYKLTHECQLPIHPYLSAAPPSREKIHIRPFGRSIIRGPPSTGHSTRASPFGE